MFGDAVKCLLCCLWIQFNIQFAMNVYCLSIPYTELFSGIEVLFR